MPTRLQFVHELEHRYGYWDNGVMKLTPRGQEILAEANKRAFAEKQERKSPDVWERKPQKTSYTKKQQREYAKRWNKENRTYKRKWMRAKRAEVRRIRWGEAVIPVEIESKEQYEKRRETARLSYTPRFPKVKNYADYLAEWKVKRKKRERTDAEVRRIMKRDREERGVKPVEGKDVK